MHLIPSDKFTTNIICVLIRRQLCREELTQNALIPPVLSRGSQKYPAVRDIRLATEAMFGSIFDAQIIKKGEEQILQFFLECADDFAGSGLKKQSLDFLQEIILQPQLEATCPATGEGFISGNVKGESENLKNRIESRINDKSEYAKLLCLEKMCAGEAFGLYGDGYAEDLPGINPKGLLKHYKKILGESPIEFIAMGKWDGDWLADEIAARFISSDNNRFSIQVGTKDSIKNIPKPMLLPARPKRQIIQQSHGSTQGNLCIGLRGEIPPLGMDFIHFQLANEILGGGPNARLFTKLREKESLCYSIYSTIYRFKSLMCILAGTEPDKMEHILQQSEEEVEALKQGKFSEEELQIAKQSLSKRWRVMQDNQSACIDFYASQYLLEDPHKLKELLSQVDKATSEGISKAISRLNIDTVVMIK